MARHLSPIAGLALAATLFATGCHHKAEPPVTAQLPKAKVRVETIASKTHMATEDVVGTVRARSRAVIEAKVTGRIEKLLVVPGSRVRKGDLLVELNAREVQARLDQARATLDQAQNDLKRFTALLQRDASTQAEFDRVQTQFRVAQATVVEAETLLGYTRVTAPIDGQITRKLADVGDLATPGRPIVELEDASMLRLEADVPETLLDRIHMGDTLGVRIAAAGGELKAPVSEIAPSADRVSRTFLVKLDLPQTSGLRDGQFGRVAIPVSEVRALRVPASALVIRGQMELVFIATNQTAQMRIVKTGKRIGNEIDLVSGVQSGEAVIVDVAATLVDGQPIEISR